MLVHGPCSCAAAEQSEYKGKRNLFRTMIFLPCATSLVSYSMIFKSLFAQDGLVNHVIACDWTCRPVDWFQNAWAARFVIIIALIWRWTGYNMVFYLAGLQNIDYSVYEASRIDGASPFQAVYEDHHSTVKAYHLADGDYVHVRNTAVV